MYCHKCGNQLPDDSVFCNSCGTKLVKIEPQESAASDKQYDNVQVQATSTATVSDTPENAASTIVTKEKPTKKKSKKRFFIIGAVILVVIIIIIAAASGSNEMDYISTVKAYKPFANSQGLPYTCGEVFGKYIESAVWEVLGDGDTRKVRVDGIVKGTDTSIAVTIKTSIDPNDTNVALMSPTSVRIGKDTTDVQNDVVNILYIFFASYDEGLKDLSEFKGEMYDLNVLLESISEATGEKTTGITSDTVSPQNVSTSDADDTIRNTYVQKVQELAAINSDLKFGLIDLISDNVYALVADMPRYYVSIYIYADGNVIPLMEEWGYGAGGNQGYQYLPDKNIILNASMSGSGREYYESYMCVDANNNIAYLYELSTDLMSGGYYYNGTEISEYEYSAYQVQGEYNSISGRLSANDMIASLSSGTDIRDPHWGELLFNGRTANSLLNVPVNSIIQRWGEPSEYNMGGGYNYCSYNGISFGFDFTGMIYNASLSPDMCTINENTLNKNRDGLAEIFGRITDEGWREDFYLVKFDDYSDKYYIYADMPSPNDTPNTIGIYPK